MMAIISKASPFCLFAHLIFFATGGNITEAKLKTKKAAMNIPPPTLKNNSRNTIPNMATVSETIDQTDSLTDLFSDTGGGSAAPHWRQTSSPSPQTAPQF